jgi:hypothetical protein
LQIGPKWKLIKGKKRRILVDTLGLLLVALVQSAGIQDRDGGIMLLSGLTGSCPSLRQLFADSVYQGSVFHDGITATLPQLAIDIVNW